MAIRFLSSGDIDGALTINSTVTLNKTNNVISIPSLVDNGTFLEITQTGNETWLFKCESLSGSLDGVSIGTSSAGKVTFDENGQIHSTQLLDVATAGGRLIGESSRGYLSSIHLEQSATGADGGYIRFETATSGTTSGVERLRITDTGAISVGSTGTNYGSSGQVLTSGGNSNPTWTTPTTGTVTGTGVNNRLAIWNGTTAIDSDSDFYVDGDTIFTANFQASGNISITGTSFLDGDVTIGDTNSAFIGMARAGANYLAATNASGYLVFRTAGSNERMRIDISGDVGIGVTDGDIFGRFYGRSVGIGGTGIAKLQINGTSYSGIDLGQNGTRYGELNASATIVQLQTLADIPLTFGTGTSATERMRITSGGQVCIGTDSTTVSSSVVSAVFGSGSDATLKLGGHSGTHTMVQFFHTGSSVGSITSTTSATSYNTSSDYRLKEDLQDFAGLDMVSKIPVYDFKWKTDDSRSYGVMAHELQEVLPQAVSGDKDAEEMQSVDYSKIVPLLVKSIQELKAEVDKLKQECKCKN